MLGRYFLVSLLTYAFTTPALAGGERLETLVIGDSANCCGPVLVRYDPALTTIIDEPIVTESGTRLIRVATLRLSPRSADTLIVDYTEGASADPGFLVYRIEECGPRRLDWPVHGLELEAPGDGYFYVRGHANSWFDMRRKFAVEGGNLREVEQPYYYVGLETRTLDQINVYASQTCSGNIGCIPRGTPVTVILSDGSHFLLKTHHDILGWWCPRNPSAQRAEEIEGIFYRGD